MMNTSNFFTHADRPRGGRDPRRDGRRGGPPWMGPRLDFGFAGGSGPFGPGPGPRGPWGGRGRARRGDVRAAILQLLLEQPRNGYQIIAAVDERTEGVWRPSPGAVYPALNQLEDEGLIESFDNDGSRAFRLTNAGREAPEVAADRPRTWDSFTDRTENADAANPHVVWAEFGQLAMALKNLSHSGSPEMLAQAKVIIADARRKVYGLLAGDASDED